MVDFNNSTIVQKSRKDIVNIVILQRRTETIDKLKEYYVHKLKGRASVGMIEFKSELLALVHEVQQMILNELPKEKQEVYKNIEELKQSIEEGEEKDLLKAFNYVDNLLYEKNITKVDSRELRDRQDILGMNELLLG